MSWEDDVHSWAYVNHVRAEAREDLIGLVGQLLRDRERDTEKKIANYLRDSVAILDAFVQEEGI